MKKIAVLMCCYNRKEKTVNAIKKIYSQKDINEYKVDIYLLDDGSTDGTEESVLFNFPDVNVIKGNGSYFWNGGMRKAYDIANQKEYDFFMWMNDDTFIYDNTFKTLLDTNTALSKNECSKIIVGTTANKDGNLTYGGVRKASPARPVKYKIMDPDEKRAIECDTINGNIVLIDKSVYQLIGNLDPVFVHGMGDFDFGLRAKAKGAKIFIAPGILGVCERNPVAGTYNDTKLSLRIAVKKLLSIKGLPVKQWFTFTKRHSGAFWFVYFTKPYVEFIPKFIFKKYLNR
ncbi:glycosyltransferase [Bacillus toyonensis]|uniref:glycosyltransferase family 2 protein n=1 Tax=Bacillus toyonensis TaxID=155322 RepID=UPI000BF758DA|nr:glycosyltransferase family 2 protein [Bacillus toyonensis]PGE18778.1 glycosyltransferase [Bacillus toyonensis]